MPAGKMLRIETLAPAVLHWTADAWHTVQDVTTREVEVGLHVADLSTTALPDGTQIAFTFYWPDAAQWEGTNFLVQVRPFPRERAAAAERSGSGDD